MWRTIKFPRSYPIFWFLRDMGNTVLFSFFGDWGEYSSVSPLLQPRRPTLHNKRSKNRIFLHKKTKIKESTNNHTLHLHRDNRAGDIVVAGLANIQSTGCYNLRLSLELEFWPRQNFKLKTAKLINYYWPKKTWRGWKLK